jgi:hypothetical protein
LVLSIARSTLAIDWDSETRSLYYDEQESEVGHWGFMVSAVCWFLFWMFNSTTLISWIKFNKLHLRPRGQAPKILSFYVQRLQKVCIQDGEPLKAFMFLANKKVFL